MLKIPTHNGVHVRSSFGDYDHFLGNNPHSYGAYGGKNTVIILIIIMGIKSVDILTRDNYIRVKNNQLRYLSRQELKSYIFKKPVASEQKTPV